MLMGRVGLEATDWPMPTVASVYRNVTVLLSVLPGFFDDECRIAFLRDDV
jgi:hypothetical protein